MNRALAALVLLGSLAACSPEQGTTRGSSAAVQVTISGEELATEGIAFPAGSELTIADGWSLELSHVLVTIGNVTLSDNPDLMPSDQSRTGSLVTRRDGPWAVDLTVPGTLPAAAGEGLATPLARVEAAALARDQRYAFGYDIVPASQDAELVNFAGDPEAQAAYAEMIEAGGSALYLGVARFRGHGCQSSDDSYDFSELPREAPFRLLFRTPASFVNCQNQDNQGDAFPDEEYQRGVALPGRRDALAQITLHLEHFLFSSTQHDPSLRFDPLAAQLVGKPAGSVLTLDDLSGVDPSAVRDARGAAVPFRNCDGSPLPQGRQLRLETGSVPVEPGAPPNVALRDYVDFIQYVQSSQGHLNGGEGICFVDRHYPSPP